MKILFANYRVSEFGGIERYTTTMIDLFSREGNQVFVLASDILIENSYVTFIKKPCLVSPKWLSSLCFAVSGIWRVPGIKKKYGIDAVIANGSALLYTDVVVAHSVHKASIIETNNVYRSEIPGWRGWLRRTLRWLWPHNMVLLSIEWFVYKFGAKKIVAVSSGIKRELIELYHVLPSKVLVIPNGVDLRRFARNNEARRVIREKTGVADDEILAFFSGHEFGRKGLRFVIEAVAATRHKNVKLAVAGKDDPAEYQKLAQSLGVGDRVLFVGIIKSGIEDYYSAADMFIFPTSYEAFALATLEAAAAGLPILTTKVNGTEELIKEGENGFFVERSGQDIAQKIDHILDNGLLDAMSERSLRIAQHYSWETVYKNVIDVLKDVVRL